MTSLQTLNIYYITLLYNKTQNAYRSATERNTLIKYYSTKRTQATDFVKKWGGCYIFWINVLNSIT